MKVEPREHPAPFSDSVLTEIVEVIRHIPMPEGRRTLSLLDPFAGIGKIHEINRHLAMVKTKGVELEPEWACWHKDTEVGDATKLRFKANSFYIVCTSPSYANRMGDNYEAKDGSDRRNYRFYLGREPSHNSSAVMIWHDDHKGDPYRRLHRRAWREAMRVLVPGGTIIVNIANHMRTLKKGEPPVEQRVSEWHMRCLINIGFNLVEVTRVNTRKYKKGENRDNRTEGEFLFVMRKPLAGG